MLRQIWGEEILVGSIVFFLSVACTFRAGAKIACVTVGSGGPASCSTLSLSLWSVCLGKARDFSQGHTEGIKSLLSHTVIPAQKSKLTPSTLIRNPNIDHSTLSPFTSYRCYLFFTTLIPTADVLFFPLKVLFVCSLPGSLSQPLAREFGLTSAKDCSDRSHRIQAGRLL